MALGLSPTALDVGGQFTVVYGDVRSGYAGFTLTSLSFSVSGLSVVQGGSATVGSGVLRATGGFAGTPESQVYMLITPPRHGTLRLGPTVLSGGMVFTQQDVNAGQVIYQHDGSATTSDSFVVRAFDGVGGNTPPGTVPVFITAATPTPTSSGGSPAPTPTPTPPDGSPAPTPTPTPPDHSPAAGGGSRTYLAIVFKND